MTGLIVTYKKGVGVFLPENRDEDLEVMAAEWAAEKGVVDVRIVREPVAESEDLKEKN